MKRDEWEEVVSCLDRLFPRSAQMDMLNNGQVGDEWFAQFAEYRLEHMLQAARRWAAVSEFPPRISELKTCVERVRMDERAAQNQPQEKPRPRRLSAERNKRCGAAARIVFAALRLGQIEDTQDACDRLFKSVVDEDDLCEYHDAIIKELVLAKPDARAMLEMLSQAETQNVEKVA